MADIRINALATTAASTASDDFVAVDGSANGTRKLNAFSPTFGGNLTVSGNAAIGTNVFKIDSTNTRILFGLAAALQGDTVEIAAKSNAGAISLFGRASNNQSVISFRQNGSPTQKAFVQGGDTGLELGAGSSIGLTINSSNNATLSGNLTVSGTGQSINVPFAADTAILANYDNTYRNGVRFNSSSRETSVFAAGGTGDGGIITFLTRATNGSSSTDFGTERARITSNGNYLIGTTIDSGNGKLQLATHTTSAGGIGFGTDIAIYRAGTNNLVLTSIGQINNDFTISNSNGPSLGFNINQGNQITTLTNRGNNSMVFQTNSTTALTLDSSQNATFAGNVTVNGTGTQSFKGTIALKAAAVGDGITLRESYAGNSLLFSVLQNSGDGTGATIAGADGAGSTTFSVNTQTGAATFSGAIAIGNTVNTVSPTSPNRTITMVIGGTTYYIHAKTTND